MYVSQDCNASTSKLLCDAFNNLALMMSFTYTFSKTTLVSLSLLITTTTDQWQPISVGPNWTIWLWTTCGSRNMVLPAIQQTLPWEFCMNNLRVWLSLAKMTWICHQDHDLTPLDLWSFLKSQVYAKNPQSTNGLKVNITQLHQNLCHSAETDGERKTECSRCCSIALFLYFCSTCQKLLEVEVSSV